MPHKFFFNFLKLLKRMINSIPEAGTPLGFVK
jgi:hypothetical protein